MGSHLPCPHSLTSRSRVLLVPLRFVGDTVLTLPMAGGIQQSFAMAGKPAPHIAMVCSKATAPLAHASPWVDEVLLDDGSTVLSGVLAKGRYSHAFIFRKSATLAYLCKQAGIPVRVGYDMQRFFQPIGFQRWGLHLTHTVPYPMPDTRVHQVVHHWGLMNRLPLPAVLPPPSRLALTAVQADTVAVDTLWQTLPEELAGKPLVAVHLMSASASKALPAQVFTNAIQSLNRNGWGVVATGLPADAAVIDDVAQAAGVPIWNLAGKTTLSQLVPVMARMQAYVGVDSGPLHMAAASGVKQFVVAYGPTNPEQWGPYGVGIQCNVVSYPTAGHLDELSRKLEAACQGLVLR